MATSLVREMILITFVTGAVGVTCKQTSVLGNTVYKYCVSACCGSDYNKYCCSSFLGEDNSATSTLPVIVGVIAAIVGVAIFVGVILCCCCCSSSPGYRGHVMTPPQPQITVLSGSSNQAFAPGLNIHHSPIPVNQQYLPSPMNQGLAQPMGRHQGITPPMGTHQTLAPPMNGAQTPVARGESVGNESEEQAADDDEHIYTQLTEDEHIYTPLKQ